MTSCVLLPTGPGTHSKVRRSWEHSTQGLLDWFEVDLGFTELLFIQIDLLYIFIIKKKVNHGGGVRILAGSTRSRKMIMTLHDEGVCSCVP